MAEFPMMLVRLQFVLWREVISPLELCVLQWLCELVSEGGWHLFFCCFTLFLHRLTGNSINSLVSRQQVSVPWGIWWRRMQQTEPFQDKLSDSKVLTPLLYCWYLNNSPSALPPPTKNLEQTLGRYCEKPPLECSSKIMKRQIALGIHMQEGTDLPPYWAHSTKTYAEPCRSQAPCLLLSCHDALSLWDSIAMPEGPWVCFPTASNHHSNIWLHAVSFILLRHTTWCRRLLGLD